MNIHAKRFDKVVYLKENEVTETHWLANGVDPNRRYVNDFLIEGNEYHVSKLEFSLLAGQCVYLIEFPNNCFPCYMFKDVVDDSWKTHPDAGRIMDRIQINHLKLKKMKEEYTGTVKPPMSTDEIEAHVNATGEYMKQKFAEAGGKRRNIFELYQKHISDDVTDFHSFSAGFNLHLIVSDPTFSLEAQREMIEEEREKAIQWIMNNSKLKSVDSIQDELDNRLLFSETPDSIQKVHDDLRPLIKSLEDSNNEFIEAELKRRNPMNQPVFTPPRSKKGWDLNVHIPQQTIDGHNAFDNHFTIIGIVTYTVLKQPNLKFNHFDWCQLHAINVSNRMKYGKWEEVTTYHILANRGDVNTIILAKLKDK